MQEKEALLFQTFKTNAGKPQRKRGSRRIDFAQTQVWLRCPFRRAGLQDSCLGRRPGKFVGNKNSAYR
jgi:hypothetical protein